MGVVTRHKAKVRRLQGILIVCGLALSSEVSLAQPARPALPAQSAEVQPLQLGLWGASQQTMHPLLAEEAAARYLLFMVAEPLVILDAHWQWQCRLCEDLPTEANHHLSQASDAAATYSLKLTFEMAKGMRWGDGKPVVGRDMQLVWEIANSCDRDFAGKGFLRQIDQVELDPSNPGRFTLYLRRSQYFTHDLGEVFFLPHHLEQEVWDKYKDDDPDAYFAASKYRSEPENPGLYNGAFYLQKRGDRGSLVLARNPHRGARSAAIPLVQVHDLKQEGKQEAGPNFGGDLIAEPSCERLPCAGLLAKELPQAQHRTLVYGDSTRLEHLGLNVRNPLLRDRNVRKALAYGVDKEALMKQLEPAEVIPAVSPMHPAHPAFNADTTFYPYDPAMAKELLELSRWTLDPTNGQRVKNNRALTLTLVTSNDPKRERLAKALAREWAKIGVTVVPVLQSPKQFADETLAKMRYEALVLYGSELAADASWRPFMHSEAIPNIRNGYSGQNISGWNSYKADQLLERLDLDFAPTGRRQQSLATLQKLYSEAVPGIPLYFQLQHALISERLQGFSIPGHQYPSSSGAAMWKLLPLPLPSTAQRR